MDAARACAGATASISLPPPPLDQIELAVEHRAAGDSPPPLAARPRVERGEEPGGGQLASVTG